MPPASGLGAYATLLRRPQVARLTGGALLGRLPGGMTTLSILLLVRETTGSVGVAGAVAGGHGIASAVGQPLQGRLIDRVGQPRVLLPAALTFAASFTALAVVTHAAVLVALGMVSGLAFPALASALRTLWPAVLRRPGDRLQTAYALDGAIQELMLLGGPLVVSALALAGSPALLVAVAAGLSVAGTLVYATAPAARGWRGEHEERHWAGPLRSPGLRLLVLVTLLGGGSLGWIQLTVTAFAAERGQPSLAGLLFACWSAASLAGGLIYGARHWRSRPDRRHLALTALLTAGCAAPALASSPAVMAAALAVAGCCLAPWLTTAYLLVDPLAPAGTMTEAFAWMVTGLNAGAAAGTTLAGAVVDAHGVDTGLLLVPAPAALAFVTLAVTRAARRGSR